MTAMEQTTHIACLARQAGLSYGAYIKKYGSPFPPPVSTTKLKEGERVCTECGKVFEPGYAKSGVKSQRKICFECAEKRKKCKPKPLGLRKVKEYAVKCSRCGADMITRRAPGPTIKNFCPKCRPIVDKQRKAARYKTHRKRGWGNGK